MPSFRDAPKGQATDAQLRIGESRDSGFDALHRPGMTVRDEQKIRRAPNEFHSAAPVLQMNWTRAWDA